MEAGYVRADGSIRPRLWTVEGALGAIGAAWRGEPALLGAGWRAEESTRLGFLLLDPHSPRLLWNGYLPDDRIDLLRDALAQAGSVAGGRLDFMFATDWKVAWTEPPARFRLYDRSGLRCHVRGSRVHVRRSLGRHLAIPRREIRAVRAEGWAYRSRSRVLLVHA